MSVLDPNGKLEISAALGDHVVARIPLAVRSRPWLREYVSLTRAEEIAAQVQELPEGTFLTVRLPVGVTREDTVTLLQKALRLIDTARARVDDQQTSAATVEQFVRDWWDDQTKSASR